MIPPKKTAPPPMILPLSPARHAATGGCMAGLFLGFNKIVVQTVTQAAARQ